MDKDEEQLGLDLTHEYYQQLLVYIKWMQGDYKKHIPYYMSYSVLHILDIVYELSLQQFNRYKWLRNNFKLNFSSDSYGQTYGALFDYLSRGDIKGRFTKVYRTTCKLLDKSPHVDMNRIHHFVRYQHDTINRYKKIFGSKKLRPYVNKTLHFHATFAKYDYAERFNHIQLLVLLKDLRCNHKIMNKYEWINCSRKILKLGHLHNGDIISFSARVKYNPIYTKMPVWIAFQRYSLRYIKNLKVIKHQKKLTPLPIDRDAMVGYLIDGATREELDQLPYANLYSADYQKWVSKHKLIHSPECAMDLEDLKHYLIKQCKYDNTHQDNDKYDFAGVDNHCVISFLSWFMEHPKCKKLIGVYFGREYRKHLKEAFGNSMNELPEIKSEYKNIKNNGLYRKIFSYAMGYHYSILSHKTLLNRVIKKLKNEQIK